MSDNTLLMDAVGYIDDRYLNEYFETKEQYARKISTRRKRSVILLTAVAAAFLTICTVFAAVMLRGRFEPPVKPASDQIIWEGIGGSGGSASSSSQDYQFPQFKIEGISVSETLYNTYHRGETNGFFCIQVGVGKSGAEPGSVVDHFMRCGIYAESVNGMIFIFPNQEDFANFRLTKKQKEEWHFFMISKPFYDHYVYGTPIVEPSSISDWEGIDPNKFGIYVGRFFEHSYSSVEELKQAYEEMLVTIGWDPGTYLMITCWGADRLVDLTYLDYESISYSAIPKVAFVTVKLWDLDIEKMKALSAEEKIGSIFISIADDPIPA